MSKITIKDTEWVKEQISNGDVAKLGGKSLDDVLTSVKGRIRQVKQIIDNSQYSTDSTDYVKAFDFSFDNDIDENSIVIIQVQGSIYRDPEDNWASFISIFRDDDTNLGKQENTHTKSDDVKYSSFRGGQNHQNSFSFTVFDNPNKKDPTYSIKFADHSGGDNTTYLGYMAKEDYAHGIQIIMYEIGV